MVKSRSRSNFNVLSFGVFRFPNNSGLHHLHITECSMGQTSCNKIKVICKVGQGHNLIRSRSQIIRSR